jgi:hypothetical protein
LNKEKDTLWFLQLRALEALGAMRLAAVPTNARKAELATTTMDFLADSEARLDVRAQAAWALGMMQSSPATSGYNYPLIGYHIGRLAAEIGEQVKASFEKNPTRSGYLGGLLVTQIYQAFNGMEGARESGLMHLPGTGGAEPYISKINDQCSSVAKAAIDLLRQPRGLQKKAAEELGVRVGALKMLLEKNPPKDFHLVPGGTEYPIKPAQVADAPAPASKQKLAGAPGGH